MKTEAQERRIIKMNWMCDGVPKNGKEYPHCSGSHEPHLNTGPNCTVCNLPFQAMQPKQFGIVKAEVTKYDIAPLYTPQPRSSTYQPQPQPQPEYRPTRKPQYRYKTSGSAPKWQTNILAILGVIILLGLGGSIVYRKIEPTLRSTQSEHPRGFISSKATYPELISQGEKILLGSNPAKKAAAKAFSKQKWQEAIAKYQQAADTNPRDPEGKIYLYNAKAKAQGNPLTIAVAVPISQSPQSAAEILRGVASHQEEFHQSPPPNGRLLEVVIVNYTDPFTTSALGSDLLKAKSILGVIGHGIDPGSQQALRTYRAWRLAAISPLTISVINADGKSFLRTIPLDEKTDRLLEDYLTAAANSLVQYAKNRYSPVSAVVFYNSDRDYSRQLKEKLVQALAESKQELVAEVDITFQGNVGPEMMKAKNKGAKTIFLAMSKNKISQALRILRTNANSLPVLGGDDLYSRELLVRGSDAVAGTVLAVPWSFKSDDSFAQNAVKNWKERITWRTATAYDATKALTDTIRKYPKRESIFTLLNQGVPIGETKTNFSVFRSVPLVQAVLSDGADGSQYQFEAIQ